MIEFAKAFGRGVLYVLLSPLLLVLFACYMIYALLCYLALETASMVLFFYGKNFKLEDAETIKLRQIKAELSGRKQAAQMPPPQNVIYYSYPPGFVPVVPQETTTPKEGSSHE
jgi:hypothetical protein